MLPTIGEAPGRGPSPLRSRRRGLLPTQQRLIITVVSAAAGLFCAWLLFGRADDSVEPGAAARPDVPFGSRAGALHHQASVISAQQLQQQHAAGGRQDGGAGGAQPQHVPQLAQLVQQQRQQPAEPETLPAAGMGDEREWFARLSHAGCSRTEQLRVCSHRGRLAVEGVAPPGSLTAYGVLYKAGVSCYDIDFMQTNDGQLLATHPDDLVAALEAAAGSSAAAAAIRSRMGGMTLAELRAAGADEERFPTAEALIKVFAALLTESGLMWREKRPPPYEDLPLLLMDLKGEAFNAEAINGIADVARTVRATPHVALFVSSPQQLALVQGQTQWRGPLIKAFMDRANPNPPVFPDELEPFALLGPSIKMADAFLTAAVRLGKPLLAWTVDTPADLHRGLEMGVAGVVSNTPLALRAALMDWRDRCSDRQRR